MDKLERIHELMEQLTEAVMEAFPEATSATIYVGNDGYRSLIVEKVRKNDELPTSAWKRRLLMDQHRLTKSDEWSKDRSADQNAYYREFKLLLEED